MPCNPVNLPGDAYAIVCTRGGRRPKPCAYCGMPSSRLCDYPLRGPKAGKTCDEPMCTRCATRPDPREDVDYCRAHAAAIATEARP